ncbi:hypothetical protein AA0119_g10425 [Alternaria tenuissima]|uniref:SPX domain-containing protein n=1 Tax=Alternaria tenuissima TaxID=119927 RepID=A0ABY0FX08_9PLEO|nr:hypothetical protein AA0119_g10425 [Alternaria tenuissima]RYO06416.1 hypothetical protein AA0121_g12109 [Alternaria tenuissima]
MSSSSSSSSVGQGLYQAQPEHFEWLIVTGKKRGHVMYSVELHHRMTGTTAVHAIRKAYKDTKPSNPWYESRTQLEDAVLSSFTVNPDPEAQDHPRAVILQSSTPLLELTEAFHNPSLLNGTGATLIRENPHFNPANGKSPIDGHYHAILIKTEASRWLIAAGMAGTIVVAAVIGFVVGYMDGNAQLGVTAGATTVAVLAFVQGCLLFLR